jgi:hypothetical protein
MGPTGAPTEIAPGETVAARRRRPGQRGAVLHRRRRCRAAGSRVLYFAGYKKLHRPLQGRRDRGARPTSVVWCCDESAGLRARAARRTALRRQHRAGHARPTREGELGDAAESDLRRGRPHHRHRLGPHDGGGGRARATSVLAPLLKPAALRASARINSPMQCMMKEICAQCLQPPGRPGDRRDDATCSRASTRTSRWTSWTGRSTSGCGRTRCRRS